jgi:hypothetical protein
MMGNHQVRFGGRRLEKCQTSKKSGNSLAAYPTGEQSQSLYKGGPL